VPKSRTRTKAAYTPPPTRSARKQVSPRWVPALMLAFFVVGIAWIVVYYVTGQITAINGYNLLIGFGLIIAGFVTSTQWR
jgi:predicted membrane-bound spermidine synthase